MKFYKLPVLLLLIYTFFWTQNRAQVNQAQIKGYVYNPDNEPAEYSAVMLMDKDSVYMKGTMCGNDGLFLFENLDQGSYFITVSNVEFHTYISAPIIVGQNGMVVLDNINLKTRVTDLEEVVIKGEKAMVEVHPDKIVFNVASSVNASGNNGLELLSKSPGVIVDMDKNILLMGKSGVRILINGRPSRISGSDLSNMLEGMRSENIESIEIISNPSAKYDAEGTGGIINIILKKNVDSGFNGNLIGSYSRGLFSRTSAGTSLNYKGKKASFFSSFNFSDTDFIDDYVQTTLREDFQMDMRSNSLSSRQGLNFYGGMDYNLNSEHTISVDARVLINDRSLVLESNTIISDVEDILAPELLVSEVFDIGPSENYNTNIHYSFVPDKSSNISADLSFGSYSRLKNTRQPNGYFDVDGIVLQRSVESEYDANTDINLFSAMLDYEKKISKITFSAGAKYSYISTSNQLAFYDIENDSPVLDIYRSNDFSYLEKIAAAYFIINAKPTERITLNAGIRAENTASLGELVSAIPNDDNIVPRNYTSLFPNVSASYNDQENHAISVSIGRRITRPNYQDLNPFESKQSELSTRKGNPFLAPNYITNYQLTYSFKRKLVISNTYSITHNFFANILEVVDDKGYILIPRNMQKAANNGLSVSYPQKVFKWWEFSSYFIYRYSTYDGDIGGTIIDLKANIFNFRMQNNFKLPLGISFELSYYATSPWIWRGTIKIKETHRVNVGVKREFMNGRLLLQFTGADIFRTNCDYYFESNYGGMKIDGVRTFDSRRIGFSATYKFGNQKSKAPRPKESAIKDELGRISDE